MYVCMYVCMYLSICLSIYLSTYIYLSIIQNWLSVNGKFKYLAQTHQTGYLSCFVYMLESQRSRLQWQWRNTCADKVRDYEDVGAHTTIQGMHSWQSSRQIHGKCIHPTSHGATHFAVLREHISFGKITVVPVLTL